MTDRELLELAANAAGVGLLRWNGMLAGYETSDGIWNPLHDDGDALRLAVMSRLTVEVSVSWATVWHSDAPHLTACQEPINSNSHAATRRAIVRAAAAIGSAKTQGDLLSIPTHQQSGSNAEYSDIISTGGLDPRNAKTGEGK